MTNLSRQKYCSVFLSLAAACAVLLLLGTAIFVSERVAQKKHLEKAYAFVRAVVEDANGVLDELNALPYDACLQSTMTKMQRTLFKSKFVKEIGFLKDGYVLCTTSSGILEQAIPEPKPTFTTPRKTKVLIDHPLALFDHEEGPNTAVIAELGSYNVVIHGGYLDFIDIPLKSWEIIYRKDDGVHHIYGSRGVYQPDKLVVSHTEFSKSHGLYSQLCDIDLGYCAAARTATSDMISANRIKIVFALLSMSLTLWFLLSKTYPFEARISSPRYRIKTGIENGSFFPAYQPIVKLETEHVVGCEVLGRYEDRFGQLYPDTFIPALKEYGLTWKYTVNQVNGVFSELGCLDLPDGFKVGFNIFPEDLTPSNIDELVSITRPYIDKYDINLEIVEDQVLDEFAAKEQIRRLTMEGFHISIDDFGTGYSNLGQLESISCHYLKIDRQFIGDIEKGSLLSSLVPQISEIASRFGLACVAEGIENNKQKELIRDLGIEFGQGWYFGKPMALKQWAVFMGSRPSKIETRKLLTSLKTA